jgi:hypothetical protein
VVAEHRPGYDATGVLVSCLCIVHCVLTPLLGAVLPLGAVLRLDDMSFHRVLAFLIIPASGIGLYSGFRRHRDWRVPLLGSVGVGWLLVAAAGMHAVLGEDAERAVTVAASLTVSGAHLWNARNCLRCPGCPSVPSDGSAQ